MIDTWFHISAIVALALEMLFLFSITQNAVKDAIRLKIRSKIAQTMSKDRFLREQQSYASKIIGLTSKASVAQIDKLIDEFDLFLIDINFQDNMKSLLSTTPIKNRSKIAKDVDAMNRAMERIKKNEFVSKAAQHVMKEYGLEQELGSRTAKYFADRYITKQAEAYLEEAKKAVELAAVL